MFVFEDSFLLLKFFVELLQAMQMLHQGGAHVLSAQEDKWLQAPPAVCSAGAIAVFFKAEVAALEVVIASPSLKRQRSRTSKRRRLS